MEEGSHNAHRSEAGSSRANGAGFAGQEGHLVTAGAKREQGLVLSAGNPASAGKIILSISRKLEISIIKSD